MKKYFAVPTMSYGRVVKGQNYRVLEEGRDYVKVVAQGASFYVPHWAFDAANLLINNEENDG